MNSDRLKNSLLLLRRLEKIAAIFLLLFGMLLLVNFLLTKNQDPLNTAAMQELLQRLSEHPEDQALRDQVRSLDLLARKAFFTRQWQIHTGGWLLFVTTLLWLLAIKMQTLFSQRWSEPADWATPQTAEGRKTRRLLVMVGLIFVGLSGLAGFYSNKALKPTVSSPIMSDLPVITNNQSAYQGSPPPALETIAPLQQDSLVNAPVSIPSVETTTPSAESQTVAQAKSTPELEPNWPAFRGPNSNGLALCKNVPITWDGSSGKNVRWKVALTTTGFNSPIVWGERLFLSGGDASQRQGFCYQTSDGSLLWKTVAPSTAEKIPKVSKDTGFAAAGMTTDGERVFAVFATGDLVCLDFNGQILWSKNLGVPDNHYGHSSSLLCWQNLLFVQYDQNTGGRLLALDTKSGAIVWEQTRKVQISWTSPILAPWQGAIQIIINANPIVAGYEVQTGKELWSHESVTGEVASSPAFSNGRVYVANEYSRLAAIEIGPPAKLLWETDEDLPEVSSPLVIADLLFVATSGGTLVCRNATTGEKLWLQEFDHGFYASPIWIDGRVYLMDNSGVMHIFRCAPQYESLADNPLGESSTCTAAFLPGRIFIRGNKHLYCIAE